MKPQREQAIRRMAERGASPIIGVGFGQASSIEKVVQEFPKLQLPSSTWWSTSPMSSRWYSKNTRASFLVGVMAAHASKSGKVGFVGGMDIPHSQVSMWLRARRQTHQQQSRSIRQHDRDHRRGLERPGARAELAKSQFSKGADVVFAAAGGTGIGVYQAAKDSGKLAIGVDSNQNGIHPNTMLTSMLKRVDVAVYSVALGHKPGVSVLGLAEGGVDYAIDEHNAQLVTPAMKKAVEEAKADILSGKIKVADYMANNACK